MISKLLMIVFMFDLFWIGKHLDMSNGYFFVAGIQAVLAFLALFEPSGKK